MDKATREYRRRLKASRTPRGQLSPFESRGLGAKNKPSKTFPTRRCSHTHGGKLIYAKRENYKGEMVSVPIIVGGTRCPNDAVIDDRCLKHHRRKDTGT